MTVLTRIQVRNLDEDSEETYTLMGRWEADPERHILSEQAPLARQFAGHREGDRLTIKRPGGGTTHYEVVSISSALESGEWETPSA